MTGWAGSDPLWARLARESAAARPVEITLGLRQYQRQVWLDSQMLPELMPGLYGDAKAVKGFAFEAAMLWQPSSRQLFELAVPYSFQEFSVIRSGYSPPASLDDPDVQRGDGLGDCRLGWRFSWLQSLYFTGGLNLEFSLPTGLGPMSAQDFRVATGAGSFYFSPALELQARTTDWSLWIQGRSSLDFGAELDLSGRHVFARRDPGVEVNAGLGWVWARDEGYRHTLELEASKRWIGALVIDQAAIPDSGACSLDLVPQAHFTFGPRFGVVMGWQLPLWLATNQAVAWWGEPQLRADFTL